MNVQNPVNLPSRGRVLLLDMAMAIVAVSIWTFAPLMALWIGSRVQGGGPPSMGAVFVVAICMLAFVLALVRLLAILDAAHQRATGRALQVRRHVPWLRSMRGERPHHESEAIQLSALERTLVIVVAIAFLLFEIWFFFFSSSPIDQRSGRAQLIGVGPPGQVAASSERNGNSGSGPGSAVLPST